jgi:hypothetical protein
MVPTGKLESKMSPGGGEGHGEGQMPSVRVGRERIRPIVAML